jgi:hypothetical protein
MVVHWRRAARKGERARGHLAVNALGAAATGGALVVILLAKFVQGAWITVLALPVLMRLFYGVHGYYARLQRRLSGVRRLELAAGEPSPIVVVPIQAWDRLAAKALHFAMRLSPDVVALHLCDLDEPELERCSNELNTQWLRDVEEPAARAGVAKPRLAIVRTPYRRFFDPIVAFIRGMEDREEGRLIAVVIPELTTRRWWQGFLHLRRGDRLRGALLKLGDPRIVVATVPWVLED